MDIDIDNTFVDSVGDEEGGVTRESSIETSALPYVKETASGNLLCNGVLRCSVII